MKFQRQIRLCPAFVMIELLMVVAIILVLFVLYWGGGFGSDKTKKQRNFAGCAKNLQTIHTALLTYSADNNEKFPNVPRAETSDVPLNLLIPKYTSQTSPFICPASEDKALAEGEPIQKKRISYAYVMGLARNSEPSLMLMSDEQVNTQFKKENDVVFASTNKPPGNNHAGYGGNLLLVDGSVKTIERKTDSPIMTGTNTTLLNPKPNR